MASAWRSNPPPGECAGRGKLWWLAVGVILIFAFPKPASAGEPRIVNIYNFIRNSDYRLNDSRQILYETTRNQIELLKTYHLPATWALQYDALMNPRYQRLLKEQLGPDDEIAAWWEIPQPLVEKAGLTWRGQHEWDPTANVGFAPGYTPEERRKLVDVYMADFKSVFGRYPRTVGSWFIDEVTLEYLADKYRIVASCNCKDQIGTDFYTLWGGYWNQAYYPSRLNAYMPAQTRAGQINVPVFRMLGSDPIYQHGTTPGLISLEPVYHDGGGGMPKWVDWFMDNLVHRPSLAFGYTQAGQENSFGWESMKRGLTNQVALFAALAKAGSIRVETLEQTGEWFKRQYPLTPATAVVALDDWKDQGHKTAWYDSRFYRLNVFWNREDFFIRDIHTFDERLVASTHERPLKETSLTYETLPIVDWAFWSVSDGKRAGMWPVLLGADGPAEPMRPDGPPVVKEQNTTDLSIQQTIQGGGAFSIVCAEKEVIFTGVDGRGEPLKWAFNVVGGEPLKSMIKEVNLTGVVYTHSGVDYNLKIGAKAGSCRKLDDGSLQLLPNGAGKLVLKFDTSSVAAVSKRQESALGKE